MTDVYMMRKEYKMAFSLLIKVTELQPSNSLIYYKIACLRALQNKPQESVEWLKKAIAKGFKNWELLKTDKNSIKIRRSIYYKDLIKNHLRLYYNSILHNEFNVQYFRYSFGNYNMSKRRTYKSKIKTHNIT